LPHLPPLATQLTTLHLRILATSDLHANLMPFDYYADKPAETMGLVRTASLIRTARDEMANCLLVDNGDVIQGSALGDLVAEATGTASSFPHPIITAMNALGYDAGTLGNHEFSHGLPMLHAMLRDATFPIVSANMLQRRGDTVQGDVHLVPPYTLLDRVFVDTAGQQHALRIGVVGVAPPQVLVWDHPHVAGRLQVRDMVQAVAATLPHLRAQGADLVLVLAHTGLGQMPAVDGMENAGQALASLPGVDTLVLGHEHQVFPSAAFANTAGVDLAKGQLHGTPAVMPGIFGSHLGVIDLTLQKSRNGSWRVQASQTEARPINTRDATGQALALVADDPDTKAIALPAHARVQAWMTRPIGHSTQALHSYFALAADSAVLRVVAHAQTLHLQALLAGTAHAHLPIVSAVAPFKAGGRAGPDNYTDIPAGPFCMRHACDLYIHPNTFAALLVTGADVAAWLERSVSIFHHIIPGTRDAPLINPDIPAFAMEMLAGLTYSVDLSQPARYDAKGLLRDPTTHRIRDLCLHGHPVDPTMSFALATNSYRAWVHAAQAPQPARVLVEGADAVRNILVAHIMRGASLPLPPPPAWQLARLPGTTVTLDSSPRAIAHLHDIARFRPEPLGLTATGFQRFRLHL
jgi:2',3'-cyclic-nucleotide 2'-phosphodiesterase / 3'-nucleotidase